MWSTFALVAGGSVATIGCAYGYYRRFQLTRPPIGVMNWTDVLGIALAIVAAPAVYLLLPLWASALLLVPSGLAIVYLTAQPLLRSRLALWLCAVLLLAADLATAVAYGVSDHRFLAVNNVLVAAIVVGVSNLWVQSGLRADHVTVLAATLTLYDFVATAQLPLMADLMNRVSQVPFAPFIAWRGDSADSALAIGIGDLLMAAVFTLAMRKAYGRRAGTLALVSSIAGVVGALVAVQALPANRALPAMTILGPLIVSQYFGWRRRRGPERSTREYLAAEPI